MKRKSIRLAECTTAEVLEQLKTSKRIFVPIGATEQHGPHLAQGTDAILATEVSERLARRMGGLVAPTLWYGYSRDHSGFAGLAWLSFSTLSAAIGDIALSLSQSGFREIIFINGNYTNIVAYNGAIGAVADKLEPRTVAYAFSYWDALPPDQAAEFLSMAVGLHAQVGETSAVLAVDEGLVDMDKAVAEWPPFPVSEVSTVIPFFFSAPGTMYRATRSGVWGDATKSSVEKGRVFLDQVEAACVKLIQSIEATFDALPAREPEDRD